MDTAVRALGMRWATWCIYFAYPFGAIGDVVVAVLFWKSGTSTTQAFAIAFVGLACIKVSAAVGLWKSSANGWRWNLAAVGAIYLQLVIQQKTSALAFGCAVVSIPLFLWPTWVYWRKRRALFTEAPSAPLRTQDRWLPVSAWCVVALAVAAAIVLPMMRATPGAGGASQLSMPATAPVPSAPAAVESPTVAEPLNSAPAIVDPFAGTEEERWARDLEAFVRTRCELVVVNDTTRAQVDSNIRIFQQALNDVVKPGMSNAELLAAAGNRVYAYSQYTPTSECPRKAVAAVAHSEPATPTRPKSARRAPKCDYSGTMTDAEVEACR
jgi:hypothetical protein